MAELIETRERAQRLILVGVSAGADRFVEESLDELEELVKTAGGETVGRLVQNLEMIHPGTYIGKGKLEELAEMVDKLHADGIVCDDELSPAQMKNLEDSLGVVVLDRTLVILDIFAGRAVTKEGKVQVELAQLRYRATRLIGAKNYSRLGGGIGTRGPGEKKLETDRRLIRERISRLKEEVRGMAAHREVTRAARQERSLPTAAIVGYTNAGKSTLLNTLTKSEVMAEDKLFATLDPTARALTLDSGQDVILTDTVGFIRKLPHHLIDAFRSTLEETKYADYLIHVVDCSNPQMDVQMAVVYETLRELGITGKPIITFFNKIDRLAERPILKDRHADKVILGSVRTGEGLGELQQALKEQIESSMIMIREVVPYRETGKIARFRRLGTVLKEEYREDGIYVEAKVFAAYFDRKSEE